MNIRLVGAALLLISTLSLSPIAEAQTGGGVDDLSCFWSSYESCDLQFGETPKICGLNAECDLLCRGASHLR